MCDFYFILFYFFNECCLLILWVVQYTIADWCYQPISIVMTTAQVIGSKTTVCI